VSSLQRTMGSTNEDLLRRREVEIIDAAREWGLGFGVGGWSSDLQLLADLQHYGTATRLMDVSSNPMTSLWFACQPVRQPDNAPALSEDGVLLAINTTGWDRYGKARPASTRSAVSNPFSWELDHALESDRPFVVESLLPNDRLRAQEGFFIAGRVPNPADSTRPFRSVAMSYEPMDPWTHTRFEV
ncbi:MAG: hypothetical protein JWP70_1838, partial [Leifsonia sp.]|nr:hypothetical protein [Leifsonia sp.]